MGSIRGIVTSGIASGTAYLAAQAIDMAITGNRVDERVLLSRLLPLPRNLVKPVGAGMHLVNSVFFSAVFRLIFRDYLRGPMWVRGVTFALIETVVLYPVALLEDIHPAIRDGELDSYQNRTAFLQQVWRHIVFGTVLGWMTPERDNGWWR